MAIGTTAALAISLSMTAVAGGVAAYSNIQAGKAQQAAHKYNAKVKENQAIQEGYNSKERIRRQRIKHRRLAAKQKVGVAKSGVQLTGSPLDVMADTAANMELEVADMKWQSDIRQADLRGQASMERWQGDQARSASKIGAAASVFGTGAKMAGTYYTSKLGTAPSTRSSD